jgi:hypothetical protein
MNEPEVNVIERSRGKCPLRYRFIAWAFIILMITLFAFIFIYAPLIVEVPFFIFLLVVAVVFAKSEGFWSGFKFFVKRILLGL